MPLAKHRTNRYLRYFSPIGEKTTAEPLMVKKNAA